MPGRPTHPWRPVGSSSLAGHAGEREPPRAESLRPRAYPVKQGRAAAPYAKALFALATESNQTELVGRELGDVAATFEGDLDLRDFFARPWIPVTARRILDGSLEGQLEWMRRRLASG